MEKMTALPKNIRQIGDIRGQEKIYLEDYVMTYIRKKEDEKEYLGVLLGDRQEIEGQECFFIRGILEIPKVQEEQDRSVWQNQIREECEKYFPEWEIQGCCVIGTYPTQQMEQLCSCFANSEELLYHLQEQEETVYRKRNGQYERIKGYFVFYEQNKKMQEYLAEVFREDSVEKESLPDKAIRNFREKVKEKGLQKKGSVMKLASSFFVVGMLAIGAIAVNRVEDIRVIRESGGDFTAENEAVSAQIQSDQEEETRLINGALMQEDLAVTKTRKEMSTEMQTEIQTEMWTEIQTETPAEESAVSWSAGNSLEGPDSFWEETETVQDQSDVQEAVAVRQIQASYVIRQGDTLADICKRYYGSLDRLNSLCEVNGITDANVIMPGQKIVLP